MEDRISGFWDEDVTVIIRLDGPRRIVRSEVDELQRAGKLRQDTLEAMQKKGAKDQIPEAVSGSTDRLAIWQGHDDREGLAAVLMTQRNLFTPPQEDDGDQFDAFPSRTRFTDLDVALQNLAHERPATPRDAWILLSEVGIEFPRETVEGWSPEDIQTAARWAYARRFGIDLDIEVPAAVQEAIKLLGAGDAPQPMGMLTAGVPAEEETIEADYEIVDDDDGAAARDAEERDVVKLREILVLAGRHIPLTVLRSWSAEQRDDVEAWAAKTILQRNGQEITVPELPACLAALDLMREEDGLAYYAAPEFPEDDADAAAGSDVAAD